MDKQNAETFELDQEFIVLAIPASTLEVEINATIWKDGGAVKVCRKMNFNEVKEAIKEAQDGYIPSDAVFTLTPLGKNTRSSSLIDTERSENVKNDPKTNVTVATQPVCNMCAKPLDIYDINENYTIHKKLGYGTRFDGDMLNLRLCCDCMESIIDDCIISPITEVNT